MRKTLAAIFAALLMIPVLAAAEGRDEIPAPSGYVNDFAGVITPDYRDKIAGIVSEIERKTGAEIAVVTIRSIAPYEEKEYARMLFDRWRIGKKGKDNGVLVLLAVQERRWRIETGYGIEGILPDGRCGEIGRSYMVPAFKAGRYGEGLHYGVAAIADAIAKDAGVSFSGSPPPAPKTGSSADPGMLVFLAIIFFSLNLSWPLAAGVAATIVLGFIFDIYYPRTGGIPLVIFLVTLPIRYFNWRRQPAVKRPSFFGNQGYMQRRSGSGSSWGGGWSGGGGGFGGGGFGGGGGGGGGAGGGF